MTANHVWWLVLLALAFLSSGSIGVLLACFRAAIGQKTFECERLQSDLEGLQRVTHETRAILSDLSAYSYRLEELVVAFGRSQRLNVPVSAEFLLDGECSPDQILESRPPVLLMLESVKSHDWNNLERLRLGKGI
jgi:hypothetical protein